MVREAFKSESTDAISEIIGRMKDLLSQSGPVSAKKYEEVLGDFSDAKKKIELYADILSSEKSFLDASLEIANKQVKNLLLKG